MNSWEDNIRKVVPYIPGEQPKQSDIIKLNTNENPYPPAPGVRKAMENMDLNLFRLYPDSNATPLVNALAAYHKVNPDQVFVGVGSDDVLAMCFLTFFNSQKPILFPDITYSFYDVWADLYRIPYERPQLDINFHIRPEDYDRENGGVIFPNPNAPTGIYEALDVVEDIIEHNSDSIVIIDEAYIDFGGESALPLLNKYENVIITRTFSKSRSMAGMRIGYAIGSSKLIGYLNDVKQSYNSYTMNQASLVLGVEGVKDDAYFKETLNKIIDTRDSVKAELRSLGFTVTESRANFLFASHNTVTAKELFAALKEGGIYVRYFDKPRIHNYLRITVGTKEEMDQLLDSIKNYINYKND